MTAIDAIEDIVFLDSTEPLLRIPGLPPPSVRPEPVFDADDAIRLAAHQLVAHLATLRKELERAPMPDADPERDPGAVSRVAILQHVLDTAQDLATGVRSALAEIDPRQRDVQQVHEAQIDVGGVEAMLTLLHREIERAPWDVPDRRLGLLAELMAAALTASRLARVGLGEVARRMTKGA